MFTNYIVTFVTMFAIIFALFGNDMIKENFTAPNLTTPDGLAPGGKFFGTGGDGIQLMGVGGNAMSRMYKGQNYNLNFPRTLGYQTNQAFPENACMKTGVDARRNIQTAPPPRFMVTEPKLNHYRPVTEPGMMPMNQDKPIDHDENVVVSQFGQVQRDSRKINTNDKTTLRENFENYAKASIDLPKDMCSVNMLGEESQPVIYDRLMYSNVRSRLRGQGDYFRGDLMIAPDSYKPNGGGHPSWFQVSVKPERDLNPGALEHMGGRKEEIALGLAEADIDVASFGL